MTWILLIVGALAGAVAGGAATYSTMLVEQTLAVNRAVKAERRQGIANCNIRVKEIESAHTAAISRAVEEAGAAAAKVEPAPETDDGLKALCKASASCRSRGAL